MSEYSRNVASESEKSKSDHSNNKGVGTLLRETRENNGQTLDEIATILRIRQPYLEALEEGRFTDLPGQTYAIGFIRGYADYLGIDSKEVVRRFKNEVMLGLEPTNLRFPTPVMETGIPSGTLIFFGFIALVLSYGAWLLNTTEDGFLSNLVSPLPERFAGLLSDEEKFPNANEKQMLGDSGPEKKNINTTRSGAKLETFSATNATEPKSDDQSEKHMIDQKSKQLAEWELSSSSKPPSIPSSQNLSQPVVSTNNRPSIQPGSSNLQINDLKPTSADLIAPIETENPAVEHSVASPSPDAPPSSDSSPVSDSSSASDTSSEISTSLEPSSVSELAAETPISPDVSNQAVVSASPETTVAELAPEESPVKSRITIKAIANSWIEIRDDFSNTNLMARLLNKGDTYDVPNQAGLSMHTGNAGALRIIVDGVIVPGIGEVGAVRRGVQLDPDALVAGTAAQ
ncbi:MAG: hypothetical protein CMF69_05530 [Magnetovibrio sp.]|nr:hypothetical protein [Magnetovibrio sp.]|tara:strand:- start:3044 stop:4417 length:1374 start_codon:yes stop_codon:yes gene_type:complete